MEALLTAAEHGKAAAAADDRSPLSPPRRAHLIGVAGSGMRALAQVLLGRNWRLTGSDLRPEGLAGLTGVRVCTGHAAENLPPETDLVVYSDAVAADNPELVRAAALGIPRYSYSAMTGRLMAEKFGLAVAGTHGKSTTTAMAAEIFTLAGCDPTVLCGAAPLGKPGGGRSGRGRWMLVEACEYRANFLHLCPRQAVILGIEADHFDCYDSLGEIERAFCQFARSLPSDGLLLARGDCPSTARAVAKAACRVETFGIGGRWDWTARGAVGRAGRYGFSIHRLGRHVGATALEVPGRHNVLNALAAAALAYHNGISPECIAQALGRFRGLNRRLETRGSLRGVLLIDDYAHHPTEVAAALETVRRMHPGRRVWCVFQPHQASRTAHLLDELARSLQNADHVLIGEIFRAREGPPRPGEVTAAELADRTRRGGVEVLDAHVPDEMVRVLRSRLRAGDVLLTMGAGDVRGVGDRLVGEWQCDRAVG